jgi:hypothetical protein
MDYAPLEEALKEGKFRAADDMTRALLIELAGTDSEVSVPPPHAPPALALLSCTLSALRGMLRSSPFARHNQGSLVEWRPAQLTFTLRCPPWASTTLDRSAHAPPLRSPARHSTKTSVGRVNGGQALKSGEGMGRGDGWRGYL